MENYCEQNIRNCGFSQKNKTQKKTHDLNVFQPKIHVCLPKFCKFGLQFFFKEGLIPRSITSPCLQNKQYCLWWKSYGSELRVTIWSFYLYCCTFCIGKKTVSFEECEFKFIFLIFFLRSYFFYILATFSVFIRIIFLLLSSGYFLGRNISWFNSRNKNTNETITCSQAIDNFLTFLNSKFQSLLWL